jgi:hypothetical protein
MLDSRSAAAQPGRIVVLRGAIGRLQLAMRPRSCPAATVGMQKIPQPLAIRLNLLAGLQPAIFATSGAASDEPASTPTRSSSS